jgi:hypothetical protein
VHPSAQEFLGERFPFVRGETLESISKGGAQKEIEDPRTGCRSHGFQWGERTVRGVLRGGALVRCCRSAVA